MAYGGGVWLSQNKVLPGTYINFASLARATVTLADRGYVAIPLELDWGIDGEVFTIESGEFQKFSNKYFGYSYDSDKLKGLRDLFLNAKTAHIYRLNSGEKASNKFAEAKYTGTRGNDIKITVLANVDEPTKWDVITLVDNAKVHTQTVAKIDELVENDWVKFKPDATLTATTALALTGGTNGNVTGTNYQNALDQFEKYYFNTLGCLSTEKSIISLFVQYTKRMRDEVGVKFQTVVYRGEWADYEGVISVQNKVVDNGEKESSMVYWVTGAEAGCNVNASVSNKEYTGDFTMEFLETQTGLEKGIKAGKFLFHKADGHVMVLTDINTFTSVTVNKNIDFTSNQTMRVLDQIAMDIARVFNKQFNGKVPNDKDGREALWAEITAHHRELLRIRAIENFKDKDVIIEAGNDKKSVLVTDNITPVNCMEKLYMSVIVA